MNKLLLVGCLIFSISASLAQEKSENNPQFKFKNAVHFELFGHGVIYSLNYERIIFNKEKYKTTIQAGGSFYPKSIGFRALWLPIIINQLFSFGQHHVEFGVGHIFTKDAIPKEQNPNYIPGLYPDTDWSHFAGTRIGYRFQKPDSRFLLRVAFTPFLEYNKKAPHRMSLFDFYPSGALTFGYNF